MMNNVYHLFARHPRLSEDQDFLAWLKSNGFSYWYDTGYADADSRVVVVSGDETSAWAALEESPSGRAMLESDGDRLIPPARLLASVPVDLLALEPREVAIRAALSNAKADRSALAGARPRVAFVDGKIANVDWEIDLRYPSEGERDPGVERRMLVAPTADDLADNELHSTWLFRQEAEQWTQGPLTIVEKARRIGAMVAQTYSYDSGIRHISEFTWRDTLVRDQNGRRGICDEYAVVQISYLRSIGIPARMKLLIWQDGAGKGVGHACVEFRDQSGWHHLDGLWNAFQNPGIYRQSGARNLTVMDADYPFDGRSDQPAWGVPDPRGDGLLYPYGDFIIGPAYPGNGRPGYSF